MGLAGALQKLNEDAGAIPGGAWASHLFIVNPARGDRTASKPRIHGKRKFLPRPGPRRAQHKRDTRRSGASGLFGHA